MNDHPSILALACIGKLRTLAEISGIFEDYSWPCFRTMTFFNVFMCSSLFPNKLFSVYLEHTLKCDFRMWKVYLYWNFKILGQEVSTFSQLCE